MFLNVQVRKEWSWWYCASFWSRSRIRSQTLYPTELRARPANLLIA
jgi:hypothetical protein